MSAAVRPMAPTSRMAGDAPVHLATGLALAVLCLPFAALHVADPRMLDGEGVWLKPLKFAASLSLYAITLAWAARWLTEGWRRHPLVRAHAVLVSACIAGEMAWIATGAAYGVRSHYNLDFPLVGAIYPLMGVLAVTLTTGALVAGIGILRAGPDPFARAAGWGMVATFALTVPIAGTLSGIDGGVPGEPSAWTVPFVGWSLRGDLHPAHFLAVHAMQAVPLAAAWIAARRALRPRDGLWLAGAWSALTLAAFGWAFV